MEERRGAYRFLVGKLKRQRPLGRPRRIEEDNISSGSGMGGMNWIDLAQDRDRWWPLVKAVMNFRGP